MSECYDIMAMKDDGTREWKIYTHECMQMHAYIYTHALHACMNMITHTNAWHMHTNSHRTMQFVCMQ